MKKCEAIVDESVTRPPAPVVPPMMGRARPEIAPDLRSLPFKRYVIYYLPLHDGIDVVRILHSARDLDGLLEGEP